MNKQILIVLSTVLVLSGLLWWWLSPTQNDRALKDITPRLTPQQTVFTIIAFGDSLTAGYSLPVNESYPAQLETRLKADNYSVKVINAGVSGETTRGNRERANFIRSQNPDIVLLGIGGNDALRLLPLAETINNLDETIRTLKSGTEPPVIVLLRMQAPLTAGLGYKRDFDTMFDDLATKHQLILVPFLTTELFLEPTNKLPDGIHYNAEGYKKVVEQHVLPAVEEILERLK